MGSGSGRMSTHTIFEKKEMKWLIIIPAGLAFGIFLRRCQLAYRDAVRFRLPLLDEVIKHDMQQQYGDGTWYLVKPVRFQGLPELFIRIRHAWYVLRGKANAFQYRVDHPDPWPDRENL